MPPTIQSASSRSRHPDVGLTVLIELVTRFPALPDYNGPRAFRGRAHRPVEANRDGAGLKYAPH